MRQADAIFLGVLCASFFATDVAQNEITGTQFPTDCVAGPLTSQEKALASAS